MPVFVTHQLTTIDSMQIIIYVDTGAGKTLVAALLAKHHIATNGDGQRQSRRVVCLVPTTILVAQQAAVFRKYVAHSVGEYTGDMGVDRWSANKWQEEISCAPAPPPPPPLPRPCTLAPFPTWFRREGEAP